MLVFISVIKIILKLPFIHHLHFLHEESQPKVISHLSKVEECVTECRAFFFATRDFRTSGKFSFI